MIGLIIPGHQGRLNQQSFYLRISWVNVVPLLHVAIEQVCEPCHGVFLAHTLKHLKELHGLSLREVDVAVDGVSHFLDDACKGIVGKTEAEFAIDTVDNHRQCESTLEVHLDFILDLDTLKNPSLVNS